MAKRYVFSVETSGRGEFAGFNVIRKVSGTNQGLVVVTYKEPADAYVICEVLNRFEPERD